MQVKNKAELIVKANEFSVLCGFKEGSPPMIPKMTVGKMGLKGQPGLRLGGGKAGGGSRGGALIKHSGGGALKVVVSSSARPV